MFGSLVEPGRRQKTKPVHGKNLHEVNDKQPKTKPTLIRLSVYLHNPTYMEKVNIREKLAQFSDHWNQRIVGELNGQHVKAVKLKGEFIWHHHDHEDELFLVTRGTLKMEFRDKTVEVNEGEFIIVPRKVEHRPVAPEEVHILLFEPASTINTGNVEDGRTRKTLEKI